jgi:hypothetical protein
MADQHRITYDSGQEDAFLVHSDSGIIKFERTPDGLYIYKPTANFKNQVTKLKKNISLHDDGGKGEDRSAIWSQPFRKVTRVTPKGNLKTPPKGLDGCTILLDALQSRISSIFCYRTSSRTVQ